MSLNERSIGKQNREVGDRVLGVAAIDVVPGESRLVAEILAARRAELAYPARPAEPGDADTIAGANRLDCGSNFDHLAHHLMAGNERQLGVL